MQQGPQVLRDSWGMLPPQRRRATGRRPAVVIIAPFRHQFCMSHFRELLVEDAVTIAANDPLKQLRGRHARRTTGREEFTFIGCLSQSEVVLEEKHGGHTP